MRIERQKRAKKWMTRYRLVHHYTEPLRVLLDPLMLTSALTARVFLREELPRVFQVRAVPVVTTCVVAFLRAQAARAKEQQSAGAGAKPTAARTRFGGAGARLTREEAYAQAAISAKRMERVECHHAKALPPGKCILDVLRHEDEECKAAERSGSAPHKRHLAAAVQDDQTRFAVRRMGVVPLACFPTSKERLASGRVGTLVMLEPTDTKTRSKGTTSRQQRKEQRQQQEGRHFLALKRRLGLLPPSAEEDKEKEEHEEEEDEEEHHEGKDEDEDEEEEEEESDE